MSSSPGSTDSGRSAESSDEDKKLRGVHEKGKGDKDIHRRMVLPLVQRRG